LQDEKWVTSWRKYPLQMPLSRQFKKTIFPLFSNSLS
jgi:hypothetical protein